MMKIPEKLTNKKTIFKVLKILVWIFAGFLTVILSIVLFVYFSKDKIKQYVIDELNKNLVTEISVENIDVSVFRTFPFVSVVFEDVVIPEVINGLQTDETLISSEKILLQFNIFEILRGEYRLKRVMIENGECFMKIFSDGSNNYLFWKTDSTDKEDSEFELFIQRVKLSKVSFRYLHFGNRITISLYTDEFELSGAFYEKNFNLNFSGDLYSHQLYIGNSRMIMNLPLNCSGTVSADIDNEIYKFEDVSLIFQGVNLLIQGDYQDSDIPVIDFSAMSEKSRLSDIEALFPSDFTKYLESFNKKGNVKLFARISGPLSDTTLPSLLVDLTLDNGLLTRMETGVKLEDLSLDLSYSCENLIYPEKSQLNCKSFNARLGTGFLNGNFNVNGFTSSSVSVFLNAEVELDNLHSLFKFNDIENLSGRVKCQIQYSGDFSDLNQLKASDFLNAESSGFLTSESINLKIKNFQDTISIQTLDGEFNQENVKINRMLVKTCESDMFIQGTALNVFPFLFLEDQQLKIEGQAFSNTVYADRIFASNSSSKLQEKEKKIHVDLPQNIMLDLDLMIRELFYNTFYGRDVKTRLVLHNKMMLLRNMSLKSMEGLISAEVIVDARPENLINFRVMSQLDNVNISSAFKDMNNFGQTSLTHEQLKGKLSGLVHFSSVWTKDLSIDLNSVTVVSDIEVKDGSVSNYEPLTGLKKYFKQRDFSNVEFSKLSNQIIIRDKEILIPQMTIHSSVMNFEMQGKHGFDNQIDYNFTIQFSEIMRNKESILKPRVEDEYGKIQEENENKLNWHFRVIGTVDQPKFIAIDMQTVSSKVKGDFKQEGRKAVEILQKEFSSQTDSTEKVFEHKQDEKPKLMIQWDDE